MQKFDQWGDFISIEKWKTKLVERIVIGNHTIRWLLFPVYQVGFGWLLAASSKERQEKESRRRKAKKAMDFIYSVRGRDRENQPICNRETSVWNLRSMNGFLLFMVVGRQSPVAAGRGCWLTLDTSHDTACSHTNYTKQVSTHCNPELHLRYETNPSIFSQGLSLDFRSHRMFVNWIRISKWSLACNVVSSSFSPLT